MHRTRSNQKPSYSKCALMMYSHDGFGLGHLKRNVNIATRAIQDLEGSALLITGHASLPFQPILPNIDFIKLPSIVKVGHGAWEPRTLPIDIECAKSMRSAIIWNAAKYYQPDLLLVDFMPGGVWGELVPTLEMLKQEFPRTKLVLGLRDILDTPSVTVKQWKEEGTYDLIRTFYDKVFIYGSPQVYNTAFHYGLTGDLKDKVSYCGYVCPEPPTKSKARVRQELGLTEENLIVFTAGGGGDGFPMMQLSMGALELLHESLPYEALFITGPLMGTEQRRSLESQAERLNARVVPYSHDLLNYMNAANLLVTMGSYNTMMEAISLKKNTIVIPRNGPSSEQRIRSTIFSNLGIIHATNAPASLTSEALAKTIKDAILNPTEERISLDLSGRENVSNQMSLLLNQAKTNIGEGSKIELAI